MIIGVVPARDGFGSRGDRLLASRLDLGTIGAG
jgi:hypothetical protein